MVGKKCRNFGLTKTKMMIAMMMPLWLWKINMKTLRVFTPDKGKSSEPNP